MKRVFAFILCFILLFLTTACQDAEKIQPETTSLETVSPETSEITIPPTPTVIPETSEVLAPSEAEVTPSRDVQTCEAFSEDRAWITYCEDETSYDAIIDPQGNVLSNIKSHYNMIHTVFSNGYTNTYNYETKVSHIIDSEGNVTFTLDENSIEDEAKVIFRDAGIIVIYKEISDFYGVGYQYTILSHDGSVLEQFVIEYEIPEIINCGKGVIRFRNKGYLCLQTNTWVSDDITTESQCETPNFTNSSCNAGIIGVENSSTPHLVILNTDGYIEKIGVDLNYDKLRSATFYPIDSNYLFVLFPYHGCTVASISLETGTVYELDNAHKELLIDGGPYPISSADRIIIMLRGADGNLYNFIFDEQMKPVCGPVDFFAFDAFSDSRIIGGSSSNARTVYDKDGNILFSLSELGYNNQSRGVNPDEIYSCGILLAYDKDYNPVYLDKEGHLLFDEYNFTNMTEISSVQ